MQKQHDTCTLPGCSHPHKARGYCQTHYMQYRRGVAPTPGIRSRVREKPPECSEDGCAEPVKAKGLCKMHYQRSLRHGHTKCTTRTRPAKTCYLGGCGNQLYAKGLCHAHYAKQRKWSAFGIDAERYQEMLVEQNDVCAICKQPERTADGLSGKTKDLAIDHDHTTGAVRALLCSSCNTALGLFQDSPVLLDAAKQYLAKHATSVL